MKRSSKEMERNNQDEELRNISIKRQKKDENQDAILRIICINDVYQPEKLALCPSFIEPYRTKNTKFILAGDFFGGSTYSHKAKGESMVGILNELNLDYLGLGNHEFDYGAEHLEKLIEKCDKNMTWLGSNVRYVKNGNLFKNVTDFKIEQIGDVKVGFFGVCTDKTKVLSHPGASIDFECFVVHSKRCVKELISLGCTYIVAVTHLSNDDDKRLAAEVLEIDLIIGGHDHSVLLSQRTGSFIYKVGQDIDYVGLLDVDVKSKTIMQIQLLNTCEHKERDENILKIMNKWRSSFTNADDEEVLGEVVNIPLSTKTAEVRTCENNFGCLVADAIKHYFVNDDIDFAVQNGGFIRCNKIYTIGEKITRYDIRQEMPFPRRPVLLEVTGTKLKEGLEQMLRFMPKQSGCFPQLSSGVKIEFDYNLPEGQRITLFKINDKDVIPNKIYRIAISEYYVMKCSDGIDIWYEHSKEIKRADLLIRDITESYLMTLNGKIEAKLHGRLKLNFTTKTPTMSESSFSLSSPTESHQKIQICSKCEKLIEKEN